MNEWVLAFVAGFLSGFGGDRAYLYSRTQDWNRVMALTKTRKPPKPHPDWYARWAPTITLALIGVVVLSLVVTIYGIRQDQKQGEKLAECIASAQDEFTSASQPVRNATVARDKAVRDFREAQAKSAESDDKLTGLFLDLITNPNPTPTPEEQERQRERFLDVLRGQARTSAAEAEAYGVLNAAEDALEGARTENPLPASPEDKCRGLLQ